MNRRLGLASLLWVVSFNLCVALIAIYWGIGWAIAILCLRHILLGIPKIYDHWRSLFLTSTMSTASETTKQQWPNQSWLIETGFLIVIATVVIMKFNIPLKNVLFTN